MGNRASGKNRIARAAAYVIEQLEQRTLLTTQVVSATLDYTIAPNKYVLTFDQSVSGKLGNDSFTLDNITTGDQLQALNVATSPDGLTVTVTAPQQVRYVGRPGTLADGYYRLTLSKLDLPGLASDFHHDDLVLGGDATLDGRVDGNDYARIDVGYNQHLTGWANGDFNYDGAVTYDDYTVIQLAYNATPIQHPPSGPDVITASWLPDEYAVAVNWDASAIDPAAGVRVQRSLDGHDFSGWYVNLPAGSSEAQSGAWLDPSLDEGVRAYYRIRAYGDGLDTAYTPKQYAVTAIPPPTMAQFQQGPDGTVSAGWDGAMSNAATEVRVYLKKDNANYGLAATLDPGTTTWTLPDPAPNSRYEINLTVANAVTESAPSGTWYVVTKPGAPVNVTVTPDVYYTGRFNVHWTPVAGLTGYELTYKEVGSSTSTTINLNNGTPSAPRSSTFVNAVEGVEYEVTLKGQNGSGLGEPAVTRGWAALAAGQVIPIRASTGWTTDRNQRTLNWPNFSPHASGYVVTAGGTMLGVTEPGVTSITLSGFSGGSSEPGRFGAPLSSVEVRAYNQAGIGPPCPDPDPDPDPGGGAIPIVSAYKFNEDVQNGNEMHYAGEVGISWTDVFANETGFVVLRKQAGVNNWGELARVGPNVTSVPDSVPGGTFYYLVVALLPTADRYSNIAAVGGTGAATTPNVITPFPNSVRAAASPVSEGSAGHFTLVRNGGNCDYPLTVNYTIGGTATPGEDYNASALTGTATFAAGQQAVTIDVPTFRDSEIEQDETVTLAITSTSSGGGPGVLAFGEPATLIIKDATPRIDVDSNNDSGYDPDPHVPGDAEDLLEDDADKPGKIVAVADGDSDADGVPDYADGYVGLGTAGTLSPAGATGKWSVGSAKFVPVVITVPSGVNLSTAKFKLTYDANDPLTGVIAPSSGSTEWSLGPGSLRLWKNQNVSRVRDGRDIADPSNKGEFVKSDTEYTAAKLGIDSTLRTVTLWVEAVKASAQLANYTIALAVAPTSGAAFAPADQTRLTGFSAKPLELSFSATDQATKNAIIQDGHILADGSPDPAFTFGGTNLPGPEWKDANLNGKTNDPGDHNYPIAYTRSGINGVDVVPKIDVSIHLAGIAGLESAQWQIRALSSKSPQGGTLYAGATAAQVSGSTLSATVTANAPVPATIDRRKLGLTWQVSADGGRTWMTAGYTENLMYVSNVDLSNRIVQTVLDIGCRNAKGLTSPLAVATAIWDDFNAPLPGVKTADGREMQYWGPITNPTPYPSGAEPADWFTYAGLVKNADGHCEAWSQLLVAVYAAQGVPASFNAVLPNGAAVPNAPFVTIPGSMFPKAELHVKDTLAGQGIKSPHWNFNAHALVKLGPDLGPVILDPSYGKSFATEEDWESYSVQSYKYFYTDGSDKLITNDTNTKDCTFIPIPFAP